MELFDFDYSNSLLNYFTIKRNIGARNKIEMSVYEFIIFIVCNDVTALFFAKTILLITIPIRQKSLMIVLREAVLHCLSMWCFCWQLSYINT